MWLDLKEHIISLKLAKKLSRNVKFTVYSWLQEFQSFLQCNNWILTTWKAKNVAIYHNILQCAIYQHSLSCVLYCITVMNITIYRYIVILLHYHLTSSVLQHTR